MITGLILAALGLGCVCAFLLWRLDAERQGRRLQVSFPALLFCLWIVSIAVWNSYFFSFKLGIDITVERVLFIASLGACLVMAVRERRLGSEWGGQDLLLGSFVAFMALSILLHDGPAASYSRNDVGPAWSLYVSGYLIPFLAFLMAKYFVGKSGGGRMFFTALFIFGAYLSLMAIFEMAGPRSLVIPKFITSRLYDIHLDRARGPFLNAAFNGLGIVLGFVSGLILLPRYRGRCKASALLLLLLYFPGVYFTHTRSVYLMFFCSLATVAFFYMTRFPKWKLAPLALILVFGFVGMKSDDLLSSSRQQGGLVQMEEVKQRFELAAQSFELIERRPFAGVGFGQFRAALVVPGVFQELQHNHVFGLAAEIGIFGALLYCAALVAVFRQLRSMVPGEGGGQGLANCVILLAMFLGAILISNTFSEPAYCPFVNTVTFAFFGLVDHYRQHPEQMHAELA